MNRIKNTLIILNYNDADTTIRLANLVVAYNSLDQIVIVDNNSPDNSFAKLWKLSNEKIHVIKAVNNKGYAAGNNIGIDYAIEKFNPEFLFITNPDIKFEEPLINKLENALNEKEEYALASAIVNQGYNIWHLPGYFGILEAMFLVWHTLHKRNIKKKLIQSRKKIVEIGVAEGSFFCLKTSAYKVIDGLDERTFLYCEENILAHRLKQAGLKAIVLPDERYNHYHAASIRKEYGGKAKAFKHFYDSWMIYLEHYIKANKLQVLFFKVLYRVAYFERIVYDLIYKKT